MLKLKILFRKLFTPVTIMFVPHANRKVFSMRMPSIGIFSSVVMFIVGLVYVFSVAIDAIEYKKMSESLGYYMDEFVELKSTISALKSAETEFERLFALGSREDVLETLNMSDTGSIDMEVLKNQIKKTIDSVGEIKDYLSQSRDLYMATPKGWPIKGRITSGYGRRIHPITGKRDFHSGFDISSKPSTPIKATADGIVSFAGYSGGNGNLVVVEHGFGYKTFYGHNKKLKIKVGQVVKRGDVIAHVGSTGSSTGPHLHYEIWKDGVAVTPRNFIKWKKFMAGKKLEAKYTSINPIVFVEKR